MAVQSCKRLPLLILKRCMSSKNVTVDPKEMELFGNLAKVWWDENGTMKLLHTMTPCKEQILRQFLAKNGKIPFNQETLTKPLKGLSILDVGCGGGIFSEKLAKLGAKVTGIDSCDDMLKCATTHMLMQENLKENLVYVNDTIENFSVENRNAYDVVIASEVIEHVADKKTFAKHSLECLKPGGSAYFTTMNRTWVSGFYYIFLCEDVLKIIPKGAHEYNKFMRPSEMSDMFAKNKCVTTDLKGFTVSSITHKWFQTPFTAFNFAMHAIKY